MHDLAIASHRVEMSSPLCMRPLLIINSTQKSDLIVKQVIIKYYKLIKVVILIFINSKYMFFKVIIEIYEYLILIESCCIQFSNNFFITYSWLAIIVI
jgi:hypothetical protein